MPKGLGLLATTHAVQDTRCGVTAGLAVVHLILASFVQAATGPKFRCACLNRGSTGAWTPVRRCKLLNTWNGLTGLTLGWKGGRVASSVSLFYFCTRAGSDR
jgi:hypothetical protein